MRTLLGRWLGRTTHIQHLARFLLVLALFAGVWLLLVVNISVMLNPIQPRDSNTMKAELLQLSEEYILALARENGDMVDGPYVKKLTAFDLKRTIPVLLESMLGRISRLEVYVNNISSGAFSNDSTTSVISHQNESQNLAESSQKCVLTEEDKKQYPACPLKIEWMRQMWKSDPCYQGYGVDGSDCSFIRFLSEVEEFCPQIAGPGSQNKTNTDMHIAYANFTFELEPLFSILTDPNERKVYAFIRSRISQMWPQWMKAARNLMVSYHNINRQKQKILVHLGLLSNDSGWKFAEMQFKGGPLGELVQWSDLISTLYILGHELKVISEVEQMVQILSQVPAAKTPCQSRKELPVNLIYTDIVGLIQFKKKLGAGYAKFSCLFRVVDSFGTEPAFNHYQFAKKTKIFTSWGGQDLNLRQFSTMFPHSPDNSFMGFVVDGIMNESAANQSNSNRSIAVVYGKNDYMWEGKRAYLDVIHSKLEVHGTVYADPGQKLRHVPEYVINHGLLTRPELYKLLQKAKIFVGLGFPYEGPAVLEAIANGAAFLNPKFDPPLSRSNSQFFKGKPTQREVPSQHPYAETLIGEPYVYTVDIKRTSDVAAVVDKILSTDQVLSYLPHEFTEEGMLQRMNAYIENQNFCSFKREAVKWPPRKSVKFILAEPGKSCKDSCWALNRICEPNYFPDLNSQESFRNFTKCQLTDHATNIYYPALDVGNMTCTLQDEPSLFSCVGSRDTLRRLCPCRTYIKGQTALCVGCDISLA